jgi:hypothetical protein
MDAVSRFKSPHLSLPVAGKNTYKNILDPIFRFIFTTVITVTFYWLFAFLKTYSTLPTRYFFGIKFNVIVRFLARLLAYMGQDFVNNLQT